MGAPIQFLPRYILLVGTMYLSIYPLRVGGTSYGIPAALRGPIQLAFLDSKRFLWYLNGCPRLLSSFSY